MNDHELFDNELRRLQPARPPAEFMDRLAARRPVAQRAPVTRARPTDAAFQGRVALMRWLAPAMALIAVLVLIAVHVARRGARPAKETMALAEAPAWQADDVEIDEDLVDSFDAIARLPGGETVRFRCREWTDGIVLRDSMSKVVVEQQIPRWEIVPVRFETY